MARLDEAIWTRWILRTVRPLACVLALLAGACQPGLGHPIAANDFVYAFTRRPKKPLAALSTASFRKAVWDRVEPDEFERISALMGHRVQADVVDTQFNDNESMVLFRVQGSKQRYRLFALHEGKDWFIDDVLREVAPLQYASMRKQAEAVLAVRDFRRALGTADPQRLCVASSDAFCEETWRRIDSGMIQKIRSFLSSLESDTDGAVGDLFESTAGGHGAKVQGKGGAYTFYFGSKDGRLVVDDASNSTWGKTLRVLLREALARGDWQLI